MVRTGFVSAVLNGLNECPIDEVILNMHTSDSEMAVAFRQDFPAYDVPAGDLSSFRKAFSPLSKEAREGAKPGCCLICGEVMPRFCISHTVPRYCLKEIAAEGKLLTSAAVIGGNFIDSEVGIGNAATFKQVCRKCDTEYFKLYETPETLLMPPNSQVMGQIAAKNLLREISKARFGVELNAVLGGATSPMLDAMAAVRAIDVAEDEKAFKTALRVGGTSRASKAFQLMYHEVLPYTAPFAFQQMINPMADFKGGAINYSFNQNPNYRIEPLHVCVLPTKGHTIVMLFRGEGAKRYREFERQFRALNEADKLQTVVKLVFAYSEDVLISPRIGDAILRDENLVRLAQMNSIYQGFGDSLDAYKCVAARTACQEYAIGNLPNPPELLSKEYALGAVDS